MAWFHKKAQPKMDNIGIVVDEYIPPCAIQPHFVFSPTDDIASFVPDPFMKPLDEHTPLELAATREYVRRMLARGMSYSEYFCLDLADMVEALRMKL